MENETCRWNVKHAETVDQAVSSMRHNSPDCSVSPQCVTKKRAFGQTIAKRRELIEALDTLKALACDSYYQANGLEDYAAKCAELFGIEQRRGYVQLFLKGV